MNDLILKDGAIKTLNDDLYIGDSDQQQQSNLLLTEKGNIKQFPDAGVGALKFLESEDPAGLIREVSMQFTADGMDVKQVQYGNGKLLINAPYGN